MEDRFGKVIRVEHGEIPHVNAGCQVNNSCGRVLDLGRLVTFQVMLDGQVVELRVRMCEMHSSLAEGRQ